MSSLFAGKLIDELMALLDRIEDNPQIRVIVLTGAGDRAFSAGADIAEFSESVKKGPDAAVKAFVQRGQAITARMEAFPKPIVGEGMVLEMLRSPAVLRGRMAYREKGRQDNRSCTKRSVPRPPMQASGWIGDA
jgi:hypothetical protein